MKKIIFDCDNTMGVENCDVDDGLALLYLLGCPDAEVIGITATYGNNELGVVYENTLQMLKEIGREEIPVMKGGAYAGCYKNEASSYLVKKVNEHPGEITILATGSLTNLQGAYEEDSCFFDKVKEIVLMGGIGKSSLVRHFLSAEQENFDTLLYLYYKNSIQDLITDDTNLQVNTLEQGQKKQGRIIFSES